MQENPEADPGNRSPSISIGGDVSGPVTVGDGNVVIGSMQGSSSAVISGRDTSQQFTSQQLAVLERVGTESEVQSLGESFEELKHSIEEEAPQELISEAQEQVDSLKAEITSEKPDLSAMEKVRTWFIENLPSILGTLTGIFTHPLVGKLVEASGEYTLSQFRQRLGLSEST